jgi:hypothetical protein
MTPPPVVIIRVLWTLKSRRLVYFDFSHWLLIPILADFEIQLAGLC